MSSEATPFKRAQPFEFTGNSLEYFRIWIVNLCLTIFTLGIYSAWAKVRRIRYFYGNTRLDNHTFSYLADPVKILKGRLIAVSIFAIYYISWDFFPDAAILLLGVGMLMLPFILIASMSFNMFNTAYRNIRFCFNRDYRGAYMMFIKPIAIILIFAWAGYELLDRAEWIGVEMEDGTVLTKNDFLPSLLILILIPVIPYLDFLRSFIIVSNTQYGERKAKFTARIRDFYGIYLVGFILMMAVFSLFIVIMIATVFLIMSAGGGVDSMENMENNMAVFVVALIIFYVMTFFVSGYLRAARTNLIFNKTTFGEISINSKLKSIPIGWIYLGNTIGIILSLGLLVPWAQIRMARYVLSCIELESRDMGDINAAPQKDRNALGEELVDAFDLDFGI